MKRFILLLVVLLPVLAASTANAGPDVPPSPFGEEFEVHITWNMSLSQTGELLPVDGVPESEDGQGWVVAEGRADSPLTEWTALEVESRGGYTVRVQTVYGEVILEAEGAGVRRFGLGGCDPLWIAYEGYAPARVRLFGRSRIMKPEPTERGMVRYDTGEAVIPPGAVYRASEVTLRPGSGVKVAMVCAAWGGSGNLRVIFRDAASGVELGHADLRPERPCSPVWGRVNRPFTVEVTAADDTVQLYDLILR